MKKVSAKELDKINTHFQKIVQRCSKCKECYYRHETEEMGAFCFFALKCLQNNFCFFEKNA